MAESKSSVATGLAASLSTAINPLGEKIRQLYRFLRYCEHIETINAGGFSDDDEDVEYTVDTDGNEFMDGLPVEKYRALNPRTGWVGADSSSDESFSDMDDSYIGQIFGPSVNVSESISQFIQIYITNAGAQQASETKQMLSEPYFLFTLVEEGQLDVCLALYQHEIIDFKYHGDRILHDVEFTILRHLLVSDKLTGDEQLDIVTTYADNAAFTDIFTEDQQKHQSASTTPSD